MYKVIHDFADLQDNNHVYHAGDEFPRNGVEVGIERIRELSTTGNKIGVALIEEMKDESVSRSSKNGSESLETVNLDKEVAETAKMPRKRKKKEN